MTKSIGMGVLTSGWQTWEYNIDALDDFLLTLFNKYSELLKTKFSTDFTEVDIAPLPFPHCSQTCLTSLTCSHTRRL